MAKQREEALFERGTLRPLDVQLHQVVSAGQWEVVDVTFTAANTDTQIAYTHLEPPTPESVEYTVLRQTGLGTVYEDRSAGRAKWGDGYIILRSTAPQTARIFLQVLKTPKDWSLTDTAVSATVTVPAIDTDALTVDALAGYLKGTAGVVSATATIPETDIADGTVLARLAANETVSGVYDFSNGIKERGRTAKVGEWTDVTYSAGDFTGSGSMTWTVASGDVGEFAYTVVGKTMFVRFYLNNTTVGGTPDYYLKIAIPGGYSSAAGCYAYMPCFADDNGTLDIGWVVVQTSSSVIEIYLKAFGVWTASTDNTDVRGTAIFEIA